MTRRLLAAAILAAGLLETAPVMAQDLYDLGCPALWYERNAIYKRHGYCFKTDRAVRVFSNDGCYVDRESDLDLTSAERARVSRIILVEKQKLCR